MKLKLVVSYIKTYWQTTALVGYIVISILIKANSSVDITIPCLIRYFTGHKCYGCGLTTAVTHLINLDISAAFKANALVFIVLPVLGFLLLRHWFRFVRNK